MASSAPACLGLIGASGFVGSAIRRAMRRLAPDVEVIEFNRPEFDLTRPEGWPNSIKGVDCILHAAGLNEGGTYDVFNVNALNVGALVRCCNDAGVSKFVYLSTGAVYGDRTEPTTPESPANPRGHYAVSKWLAERKIWETFAGQAHILRLYFPYGRGQSAARLVPRICRSIRNGEPVHCNPDGGPRFNLGHVDDMAAIIAEDFILGSDAGAVANIASDQVIGIEDLARSIAAGMDRPVYFHRDRADSETLSRPYGPGRWRPFDAAEVLGDSNDASLRHGKPLGEA